MAPKSAFTFSKHESEHPVPQYKHHVEFPDKPFGSDDASVVFPFK